MYNKNTLDLYQQRLDATIEARNLVLSEGEIDWDTLRSAWFNMAHLLLPDDAHVVHMGCGDGSLTFAMAALYPHIHFTGLDKNKARVSAANKRFDLDNLDFKIGDATSSLFPKRSLDAIIDSHFLHSVYSGTDYNELAIHDTLKRHYDMLKVGGQLFVKDFAGPRHDEFVLLELPDEDSDSDDIEDFSDAELLVWFSEHVRPAQDFGYSGFFLEELPSQFEGSRLFRLPHKWAYEFIMRRHQREDWAKESPIEYTFFTSREMRESLGFLGMRVPYAAPHWDERMIREDFADSFRMYSDDGSALDYPAASYITLGIKTNERESLQVLERRPAHRDNAPLSIVTMRNEKTNILSDIVRLDYDVSEVLPYYITEEGRLKVYLHTGRVRSVANTIPRAGKNISRQRYSGHMIEPLAIEVNNLPDIDALTDQICAEFTQAYCGLKAQKRSLLEKGPDYYPAADYIDQRILSYYIAVMPPRDEHVIPPKGFFTRYQFQEQGHLKAFDAQQILDAIGVGLIPNAHLEVKILALFAHLNLKPENWTSKDIQFQKSEAIKPKDTKKAFDDLLAEEAAFEVSSETAGQLRQVNSIFVEEGQARGSLKGLAHEQVSFVMQDGNTDNIAVVLPLAKGIKGEVQAGVLMDQMPVVQQHEGNGAMVMAPRYILPAGVTNLRQVKTYLADKLSVKPENIIKMGEPYFTHLGVTPQKIYPFAVAVSPKAMGYTQAHFVMPVQLSSMKVDAQLATLISRAYRYLGQDLQLDAKMSAKFTAQRSWNKQVNDLTFPLSYYQSPLMPAGNNSDTPDLESGGKVKNKPVLGDKTEKLGVVKLEADAPLGKKPAVKAEIGSVKKAAPVKPVKVTPLAPEAAPLQKMAHDASRLRSQFGRDLRKFMKDIDPNKKAKDADIDAPSPEKW